jgi:hypothetical protein
MLENIFEVGNASHTQGKYCTFQKPILFILNKNNNNLGGERGRRDK